MPIYLPFERITRKFLNASCQNGPSHTDSHSNLPPELWELICTFLSDEEICRLAALNRVFLTLALNIHYGTFFVQHGSIFPSKLKSISRPQIARRVHTLYVPLPFLPGEEESIPPCIIWPGLLLNSPQWRIKRAKRRLRRRMDHAINQLHFVDTLRIEYGQLDINTLQSWHFHSLVWKNFSQNLIHLDLRFASEGCSYFTYNLDPTLRCPNVRTLRIALGNLLRATPWDQRFDEAMKKTVATLSSLVPHVLDELILEKCYECNSMWITDLTPVSLGFFKELKKLVCNGYHANQPFPFDIIDVVNNNLDTLKAIQIYQDFSTTRFEDLRWHSEIHHIAIVSKEFYRNRGIFFSQLEVCSQLKILELSGPLEERYPRDPISAQDYEVFHQELLQSLARCRKELRQLYLPIRDFRPMLLLTIAQQFPKLEKLVLQGLNLPAAAAVDPCCKAFISRIPASIRRDPRQQKAIFETCDPGMPIYRGGEISTDSELCAKEDEILQVFANCAKFPLGW